MAVLLALLPLGACSSVGVTGQVGYTQMQVSGNLALTSGTGPVSAASEQDIGSAFGLGDRQGSPYLRAQADLGVPVLTLSAFQIEESGAGTLESTFGGLSTNTPVRSDLEITNAKASLTFDIGLGPVKVSPGLALDVFDLYFKATETQFGNSETIDELIPFPLLFLRAEAGLGPVSCVGEIGFLETPEIDGAKGRVLDLDVMVEWSVLPLVEVFAGYRLIDIAARGQTDTESFDADLQIDGWVLGGGIRF